MNLTIDDNYITFSSGLNRVLKKSCNQINVGHVESLLHTKSVNADFQMNKTAAFCVQKISEIFDILMSKTNAKIFDLKAPNIRIYNKQSLNFSFQGYGFCITESRKVLKDEFPYETGSIFYDDEYSIEELNNKLDESYSRNERSSSHYLSPFIHEIMHGVYVDYIYKKYGYEGQCPYTRKKYSKEQNFGLKVMGFLQQKVFNSRENEIIKNNLGLYSLSPENQYHEIFAETFTKLICNCLSEKDSMPVKNPLDDIKNLPSDFLQIIAKLFQPNESYK